MTDAGRRFTGWDEDEDDERGSTRTDLCDCGLSLLRLTSMIIGKVEAFFLGKGIRCGMGMWLGYVGLCGRRES